MNRERQLSIILFFGTQPSSHSVLKISCEKIVDMCLLAFPGVVFGVTRELVGAEQAKNVTANTGVEMSAKNFHYISDFREALHTA